MFDLWTLKESSALEERKRGGNEQKNLREEDVWYRKEKLNRKKLR